MRKDLFDDLYQLEEIHWWHTSKRRAVIDCIENFLKKRKATILDVGCGTGKNLEEFVKLGQSYGIDSSKEAVKYCAKRGLQIKLGNAEKMPFKPASFDVITLLDVLEHTDDNKTLKEAYRILRRNGLLILTVPAYSWLWSQWDQILNHKRRYSKKNIISLLKDNKFQLVFSTYLYSYLVLPALIIRKVKAMFFKKKYSSDFLMSNSVLNFAFFFLSRLEFQLARRMPIPIGTSILAVARK